MALTLTISLLVLAGGGGFALAVLRTKGAGVFYCAACIYVAILLEFTSLIALKVVTGEWLVAEATNPNKDLFAPHPYLIGMPKPGASLHQWGITITHTQSGYRSNGRPILSGRPQIVAIGGSTTYGVAVNDRDTWPSILEQALHDRYSVLNAGVPGQTTVEHMHFAAFQLAALHPEIVLFNIGLNDLHVSHASTLAPDYVPFHPLSLTDALGLCPLDRAPDFAIAKIGVVLLSRTGLVQPCFQPEPLSPTSGADSRAMILYERNIRSLIALAKIHAEKVYLLPQVIIPEFSDDDKFRWWTPYIPQAELAPLMRVYNQITERVAQEEQVPFIGTITSAAWGKEDFADSMHFNARGNRQFAGFIAEAIPTIDHGQPFPSQSSPGQE